MTLPAIAGIILSGGASRRMGTPKALLSIRGETFIDHLVDLFSAVCSPVVIVLGHGAERIREGMARSGDVLIAVNPDPDRGMLSSLQCGLRTIQAEAEAALFMPVDYPGVHGSTLEKLARACAESGAPVTIPVFDGRHGHPVCISRRAMAELLALPTVGQARDVIRAHRAQTCFVDVDDPGTVSDIDYPGDYLNFQARIASMTSP